MASPAFPKQRKHFPLERRPRMLKDFLLDDLNSCSSSGFESFPRKPTQNPIQIVPNAKPNNTQSLRRSRSKAASATISAFQAMFNAAKNIHFTAAKSPSFLPRSLSHRLSKKNSKRRDGNKQSQETITVRVRDIMRWKSFRDLIDAEPQPLDFATSPQHCTTATITTTTTTTTTTSSTTCSSNGSSWCDSDFTSDYLPSWSGNFEEYGEKFSPSCVGKDPMEVTTEEEAKAKTAVGPKGALGCEEKEQHSPVSVFDFQYQEDEETFFSSLERKKLSVMQKIRPFESLAKLDPVVNLEKWMSSMEESSGSTVESEDEEEDYEEEAEAEEINEIEERSRELLNHVKTSCSLLGQKNDVEELLLDLFTEGLTKNRDQERNEEVESDMVRVAKAWLDGEKTREIVERGEGDKRKACVRDMEREGRWNSKFEEEKEEVAVEAESGLMSLLVDELLLDLFYY